MLNNIVTKLDGDLTVSFEPDNHAVIIKSETGQYKLATMDADDFPTLPEVEGSDITLSGDVLKTAISAVSSCVSNDETKQVLTGINLQTKQDKLYFYATNGHVLSRYIAEGCKDPINLTVPASLLSVICKQVGESVVMTLAADGESIKFICGETIVTGRVLQGDYPACEQLIPAQYAFTSLVNVDALKSALQRVATFADQKNNLVKFGFAGDRLTIECDTSEVGAGKETIKVDNQGDDATYAFNIKYLQAGLSATTANEVSFNANAGNQPCTLTSAEPFLFLIMPVQVVR
jgi:DNA polymerase-3 subunit beta